MTGKETSYFFSFSQKVPPLKVFHTRYKCVLFFGFGLIGIQSISSIVLISLTAKLAITGEWGRPQQAVSHIWPEARFDGTEHLYIQMPSLRVCGIKKDNTLVMCFFCSYKIQQYYLIAFLSIEKTEKQWKVYNFLCYRK